MTNYDATDWNRHGKNEARNLALSVPAISGTSIWLPGSQIACLREALKRRIIHRGSDLIIVERDPATMALIRLQMGSLGFHNAEFIEAEIAQLQLNRPIDFAFLDFVGTIMESTAFWMRDQLSHWIHRDTMICATLSTTVRGNDFFKHAGKRFRAQYPDRYRKIASSIDYGTRAVRHFEITPYAILLSIFFEWSFSFISGQSYIDTVAMKLFRLGIFEPRVTTSWPDVAEIAKGRVPRLPRLPNTTGLTQGIGKINEIDEITEIDDPLFSARSLAARKAWITRRQNNWVHPSKRLTVS